MVLVGVLWFQVPGWPLLKLFHSESIILKINGLVEDLTKKWKRMAEKKKETGRRKKEEGRLSRTGEKENIWNKSEEMRETARQVSGKRRKEEKLNRI